MSKSIVQREKECYICRYLAGEQGYYGELPSTGLHRHHIMFGTANRKKSEHYGLWVYLCVAHHEYGPDAVHTETSGSFCARSGSRRLNVSIHMNATCRSLVGTGCMKRLPVNGSRRALKNTKRAG